MPATSKLHDRFARCEECGTEFVYTPAEQRRAQSEGGGVALPALCAGCRTLERRMRTRHSTGTVKWFDRRKGFGFLTSDAGEAIFVHRSGLAEGTPALWSGQRVAFRTRPAEKGLEALAVRSLDESKSGEQARATGEEAGADDT